LWFSPLELGRSDEAKAATGAGIDTGPNVIVTIFGPSTQAANAATTQIPIVFCPSPIQSPQSLLPRMTFQEAT